MTDEWAGRDLADEATGELRTEAPDPLAPIDESAPVSGHRPPALGGGARAPENDWTAAQKLVFPQLRRPDIGGVRAQDVGSISLADTPSHTEPIVNAGPVDLTVVYALAAEGFTVLINMDHLGAWGIDGARLHQVALANLAGWSKQAEWTEERTGERRLLSSSTGDGYDAARILLPEARARIAELASGAVSGTRILVGLPEQDLLVAGPLVPGDDEFADLFREFLAEQSAAAVEPVDGRVFELRGSELVEFTG